MRSFASGRAMPRRSATVRVQADDPDVDLDRAIGEAGTLPGPVEPLDGALEALGDSGPLVASESGIRKQNSSPPNRACRSRDRARA